MYLCIFIGDASEFEGVHFNDACACIGKDMGEFVSGKDSIPLLAGNAFKFDFLLMCLKLLNFCLINLQINRVCRLIHLQICHHSYLMDATA